MGTAQEFFFNVVKKNQSKVKIFVLKFGKILVTLSQRTSRLSAKFTFTSSVQELQATICNNAQEQNSTKFSVKSNCSSV